MNHISFIYIYIYIYLDLFHNNAVLCPSSLYTWSVPMKVKEDPKEHIVKTLRNYAELTANNSKNWDNYEVIVRDALTWLSMQGELSPKDEEEGFIKHGI